MILLLESPVKKKVIPHHGAASAHYGFESHPKSLCNGKVLTDSYRDQNFNLGLKLSFGWMPLYNFVQMGKTF